MLGPATTLEDAQQTLSPGPLVKPDEFVAYYRDALKPLRGQDLVGKLTRRLGRSHGSVPFKALIMGHAGVGKSTELTRLTRDPAVQEKFRIIRFNIADTLDPISFQPFDVLLVMLLELVQQTSLPISQGGAGQFPRASMMRELESWFAETNLISRTEVTGEAGVQVGAGTDNASLWNLFLPVMAKVNGEAKYAQSRSSESVRTCLRRLDGLTRAANNLMVECNRLLREATEPQPREWLFLGEDFEKAGVAPQPTEDFFITYANVLRNLQTHFIFTLPISLGYSDKADHLPISGDLILSLPDIMVFDQQHRPHVAGRAALRELLEARMVSALFEPECQERLLVASGGNLRDLFRMVSSAADSAVGDRRDRINHNDATQAIRDLRTHYERKLGESPFELESKVSQPSYEKKVACLLKIYEGNREVRVPTPELYSLLRARAVQEFNGDRWFGVHPLVVDILAEQGQIPRPLTEPVPGGTK
jgi:hypothetical protein